MSSKAVRTAVETYLRANWLTTSILGEENTIESPPSNLDPWVSFGFQGFDELEIGIGDPGNNCHRENGLVYVNVWVASGRGPDTAMTYAESIRALLRHKNLGGGIRLRTASPPNSGIPSQTNSSTGNWYAFQVDVFYEYDYST